MIYNFANINLFLYFFTLAPAAAGWQDAAMSHAPPITLADQLAELGGPQMQTQASSLYDRLRHDVLMGRLQPGQKLRIRLLMELYRSGQTPIREALNRLTSDGLIAFQDQRGFTVAPTSPAELAELTKTRCWVEELALRRAMAAATPVWEEALVVACHRLIRTRRSLSTDGYEENPEWEARHRAFHRQLLAPCGSRPLRGFCDQLADQLYRYRQLSVRKIYPKRDINAEHDAILQSVLDGDPDRAVRHLIAHYEATAAIVSCETP
jgi:DNA-binding GntR family transcriptional regulator